jgi:hypothetical protein
MLNQITQITTDETERPTADTLDLVVPTSSKALGNHLHRQAETQREIDRRETERLAALRARQSQD